MRPRHITRISALPLVVLSLLLVTLLAACGAQGSSVGQKQDVGAPVEMPAASGGSDEEPTTGGGPTAPDGNAAPIEQRIIKTGEIALEVDNVASMLARVRGMAVELGGYVGGSQAGTLDDSASVTLRIPAARFDELIGRLHEIEEAEVVSESTREQDVTRAVIDLEARVRNLEASEASYRVLLDRAEKIEDVLTVQTRLDEVRGQIEQLNGQLQAIEGDADLSTLTVTLIPRGEPVAAVRAGWDPKAQLDGAVAALIGLGQGILDLLIWLVIVWVPILLVLGLVALGVIRAVSEVRRRMPAEAAPAGDGPRS